MKKEEILKNIKDSFAHAQVLRGRNSMGVSESLYNPYFLVGKCFAEEELSQFSETGLNNLMRLAEYATEAFY